MTKSPPPYPRQRETPVRARSAWSIFGLVVAIVVAIAGLALVGAFIIFVIAMSNYGSNK